MTQQKENIRSLTDAELLTFLKANKQQSFRAKQISSWIWDKGVGSFEAMNNLPEALRSSLAEHFFFDTLSAEQVQTAADGTTKTAWKLHDGLHIESVLIPGKERFTVCVSSQVGCKLGCLFCATASLGFKRNLSVGEIFEQVVKAKSEAEKRGGSLSNIVLMGMGEPLLNYENVLTAIARITAPEGMGMSPSRITLSTVGIAPQIKQLADDNVRFNLALSLHSAKEEVRKALMPIAKMYSLNELADSLKYFVAKTDTRPTFEYLLLKGVNDSLDDAKALAVYCRQFPVKINIIEYNENKFSDFQASDEKQRNSFVAFLESKNIIVNVRRSKGKEIAAACGQLAGQI
ncbi:putative dual-specificity RNA methyltransferase RlmN [Bacteroidia bacterium]|nr:putative dual-specificity RNA methyltransferase RlmN [Bacteroidia bacterium]